MTNPTRPDWQLERDQWEADVVRACATPKEKRSLREECIIRQAMREEKTWTIKNVLKPEMEE